MSMNGRTTIDGGAGALVRCVFRAGQANHANTPSATTPAAASRLARRHGADDHAVDDEDGGLGLAGGGVGAVGGTGVGADGPAAGGGRGVSARTCAIRRYPLRGMVAM